METYYEEIERMQKDQLSVYIRKSISDKIIELIEDGADIASYTYSESTEKIVWKDSDGWKWSIIL